MPNDISVKNRRIARARLLRSKKLRRNMGKIPVTRNGLIIGYVKPSLMDVGVMSARIGSSTETTQPIEPAEFDL